VKRNAERFPADFMFQLAPQEVMNLKSQNVISSWGGSRGFPYGDDRGSGQRARGGRLLRAGRIVGRGAGFAIRGFFVFYG